MKAYLYLLPLAAAGLTACGGDANAAAQQDVTEASTARAATTAATPVLTYRVGEPIEVSGDYGSSAAGAAVAKTDNAAAAVDGIADGLSVTGTVVSDAVARPSSKTGGLLTAVTISDGDDVRRGQVIARVDATELAAAEAEAQAGLAKARRDLERVEALFGDSVATRTQRDDAATGVEVVERQLERIRFNRSQNTIVAPISGRVVRKLANAGETVGPGQPVAVIQGTTAGDWRVRVGLTDAQWAGTRVGQAAEVRFDAYPGRSFAARLAERATAADPQSATFPVELKLRKQPPSLAAGLLANVALAQPTSASTADGEVAAAPLYLPVAALGRVNGKRAEVFTVDGGAARAREVLLGTLRGGRVEVLSGVDVGEEVVTTGVAWLRDGDAVRVGIAEGTEDRRER